MNTFFELLLRAMAPPPAPSQIAATLHRDGSVSADVETFLASPHGQRELHRAHAWWEKHVARG